MTKAAAKRASGFAIRHVKPRNVLRRFVALIPKICTGDVAAAV
jgi:hypothetical protein